MIGAMKSFTLSLYRKRHPGLEGLVSLTFDMGDETAAVARMQQLYPERLAECDYAKLLDDAGNLIWEKGNPNA